MTPFRFVHAADLHLDAPFRGLREANPAIAEELKEATFRALANIADLCLDREAEFLVIAGDVFDGQDRSLRAQTRLRVELSRLADRGIHTYIVCGNHDPQDRWLDGLAWPEQVHFFGADQVERVAHRRDGEDLAALYGISYARRDVGDNLALGYRRDPGDRFAIGLLHTNVGGDPDHEGYAPCSLEDLRAAGMDYWALGHIHRWAILQEAEPAVVYAGNPQGRHPDEEGTRGCMVVEAEIDGRPRVEFVPTDTVRWASGEVSIEGQASTEELLGALEDRCLEMQEREAGHPIICRLRIVGRGGLHRELGQRGIGEFVDDVRERLGAQQPFVWVDRIDDHTRAAVDVAERARGEDFVGDFLRLAAQSRTDPEKLGELRTQLQPLFGHRFGKKHLEMFDEEGLLALLAEAQARCLDLMLEGEE